MSPAAWAVMALAGGAGAVCRYLVDGRVTAAVARRRSRRAAAGGRSPLEAMPVGTIVVNLTACFALGLLTGWAVRAPAWAPGVLETGFLGGYSTFSTACAETARLLLDDAGPDIFKKTHFQFSHKNFPTTTNSLEIFKPLL